MKMLPRKVKNATLESREFKSCIVLHFFAFHPFGRYHVQKYNSQAQRGPRLHVCGQHLPKQRMNFSGRAARRAVKVTGIHGIQLSTVAGPMAFFMSAAKILCDVLHGMYNFSLKTRKVTGNLVLEFLVFPLIMFLFASISGAYAADHCGRLRRCWRDVFWLQPPSYWWQIA